MFLIGFPLSFYYALGVYIFIKHFSKLLLMPGARSALHLLNRQIYHFLFQVSVYATYFHL